MNANAWTQILEQLAAQTPAQSFEHWLAPLRYSHIDEQNALHLVAPNENAKSWLEAEYTDPILQAAESLELGIHSVLFFTEDSNGRPRGGSGPSKPTQKVLDFSDATATFNPQYRFDRFVVGSCNEFAHAAARAVANQPAGMYNPLYIYGGVGMGKTHLMHAIGQELLHNYPAMRIVYVSSEQFMNEMIRSLRYDRMGSFHDRFRSADALLIDDIQMLGKRERTQEELFHTFNALHNAGRQIVISSDSPPKQVPGLVERLRSRFNWGLLADIQQPDLETKMAILDRRADEEKVDLPEEVRVYLARQIRANIRELEGSLIRLRALSSLFGSKITLAMAKEAIQSIQYGGGESTSIDAILTAVAEEFQLRPAQLRQRGNARSIALPRQIAMYLAKDLTGSSLPDIGRAFGGMHHTTVLHAVRKIERLCESDPSINSVVHKLTDRFN